MSVITIMAGFLAEELEARDVHGVTLDDCAEMLRSVIDRTAGLELVACRPEPASQPEADDR